jgi:iron complex transport system substrate-binding protein
MGETCVPNHPKRLITISEWTLANAVTFGVKPIGSTTFSAGDFHHDGFPKYAKNMMEGIEPVGDQLQPSLEKILLLKPDLIVGWEIVREIYPFLSKIAPTVLGDWRGGQETWREHIDFVAEVLGKEEAARRAWNQYYQRIEELKTALGDRYQNKEISVTFITSDTISILLKNSFDGTILNDAGLKRPQAQNMIAELPRIEISEEELEKIDGDILFVVTGDVNKTKLLKRIQEKPLWNNLRVVQQNRVYFVNAATWVIGNLLAADAVIDDLYKYLVEEVSQE